MNTLSPYEPRPGDVARRQQADPIRGSAPVSAVYKNDVESGSVRRVLRKWPLAVVVAVAFALLALVYCQFAKKVYESTAEVLFQTPNQQPTLAMESQLASLAGITGLGNSSNDIPTQIEVMTSDDAIREIAGRTGINPNPAKSRPLITITPHKTSASIVLVSVRDPSPTRAQAAVRALVDVYNEHMGHEDSTVTGRMIMTTEGQISSVKAQLASSEQALSDYSSKVGTVDPATEAVQKVEQLYTIHKEQLDAERDLSGQQTQYDDYKKQVTSLDPSIVPSLNLAPSPLVQTDQGKLSDLEEQRSKLAEQYTPADDEMKQNQQQIDAVRNDIRLEMQREAATIQSTLGTMDKSQKTEAMSGGASGYIVDNLTRSVNPVREAAKQKMVDAQAQMFADNAELAVINKAIDDANSDMSTSPDKMRRLGDLKNNSEVYQKLYDDLQEQLVQLNDRRPADQSYATMLQLPTLPKSPSSPKVALYTAAAALFGLIVGVLLLFILDNLNPKVRDASDIAMLADIPVLLSLPCSTNFVLSPKNEQLSRQSYQRLASTLSYMGVGTKVKTIMLTSAGSDEGSSVVAAKLAAALSAAGRKIILVDATGIEPKVVPVTVPTAVQLAPDNIASATHVETSMTIKSNGSSPMNVDALLASSETASLVEQLKVHADVVIFDAPAVFDGINSALLADQVDAVLYVSKLQGLTRDEIRQALGLILNGSAPVLGVVLNDSSL